MSLPPDSPLNDISNKTISQSQPINPVIISRKSSQKEERNDSDSDYDNSDLEVFPNPNTSVISQKSKGETEKTQTEPIRYNGKDVIIPNWYKLKPGQLSKYELELLHNEIVKEKLILPGTTRDPPSAQFLKFRNLFQRAKGSPIKEKHRSIQQLRDEFTKPINKKQWESFVAKYQKDYKPELFQISHIPENFEFLNNKSTSLGLRQTPQKKQETRLPKSTKSNQSENSNPIFNNNHNNGLTLVIDSDDSDSDDDEMVIPQDPTKQVFNCKGSKFMNNNHPPSAKRYLQTWLNYADIFIKEYKDERRTKSSSELNMKKSSTIHQLVQFLSYHHMILSDNIIDKFVEFYPKDYSPRKLINHINNLWQTTYKDYVKDKTINKAGERVKPFKWTLTIPKRTSKRSIINVFADADQYQMRKKKKRRKEVVNTSPYSDDNEMSPYNSDFYRVNKYSHPDDTAIVKNLQQNLDKLQEMQRILARKMRGEPDINKYSIREMLESPKRGLDSIGIDKASGEEFAKKVSDLIDDKGSAFKYKGIIDAMNASSNIDLTKSLQGL